MALYLGMTISIWRCPVKIMIDCRVLQKKNSRPPFFSNPVTLICFPMVCQGWGWMEPLLSFHSLSSTIVIKVFLSIYFPLMLSPMTKMNWRYSLILKSTKNGNCIFFSRNVGLCQISNMIGFFLSQNLKFGLLDSIQHSMHMTNLLSSTRNPIINMFH